MRIVFLLLVFANIGFFAWSQGYFGATDAGHEPQRVATQLNPDKLRILSNAPPPVEVCQAVVKLHAADAQRLLLQLSQKLQGATTRMVQPVADEAWDIVITGFASRAAADARLAEVKKLGLADAHLVSDAKSGEIRLQLTTEPKQAAAEDRIKEFTKKGIKSAKAVERPPADEATVQVRGPVPVVAQLGAQFADLGRDFPGATLADCPAN